MMVVLFQITLNYTSLLQMTASVHGVKSFTASCNMLKAVNVFSHY